MTLGELIREVKIQKPNGFNNTALVAYVNEIESDIYEYLGESEDYEPLTTSNMDTQTLRVPEPYSALYIPFLNAKIDFANEEFDSYANNQSQFAAEYANFKAWVVRTSQHTEEERAKIPTEIKNWF